MPTMLTTYFGEMEYPADSVFSFPAGVPGFDEERNFVFLRQPHTEPLMFMQSLANPKLCFVLLPVLVIDPQYRLALGTEELHDLRLSAEPRMGEDMLCGGVVSLAEGEEPTINLLAPIVLNLKDRIGMQVILSTSGYSHKHSLSTAEEMASCS